MLNSTQRPSFENYFMQIAKIASSRSTCIRAQVGAVIVKNKEVVSTGYNGMPDGVQHCITLGSCFRVENSIPSGTQYETCRSIHAEQNAIIQAGKRLTDGSEIFIFGHSDVCILCKRFIIRAGIQMVYLQKDSNSEIVKIDPNSWKETL